MAPIGLDDFSKLAVFNVILRRHLLPQFHCQLKALVFSPIEQIRG